jgi:hypothetical protein
MHTCQSFSFMTLATQLQPKGPVIAAVCTPPAGVRSTAQQLWQQPTCRAAPLCRGFGMMLYGTCRSAQQANCPQLNQSCSRHTGSMYSTADELLLLSKHSIIQAITQPSSAGLRQRPPAQASSSSCRGDTQPASAMHQAAGACAEAPGLAGQQVGHVVQDRSAIGSTQHGDVGAAGGTSSKVCGWCLLPDMQATMAAAALALLCATCAARFMSDNLQSQEGGMLMPCTPAPVLHRPHHCRACMEPLPLSGGAC